MSSAVDDERVAAWAKVTREIEQDQPTASLRAEQSHFEGDRARD